MILREVILENILHKILKDLVSKNSYLRVMLKNSKIIQHDLFYFLLEENSPKYDKTKRNTNGKIFILERNNNKKVNINDLQWVYLQGDRDFRSEEVEKLRDEADIIITNPPFSLFREFVKYIFKNKKEFSIISNINCITYESIFPPLKSNKIWLGNGMGRCIFGFIVPDEYELYGHHSKNFN